MQKLLYVVNDLDGGKPSMSLVKSLHNIQELIVMLHLIILCDHQQGTFMKYHGTMPPLFNPVKAMDLNNIQHVLNKMAAEVGNHLLYADMSE